MVAFPDPHPLIPDPLPFQDSSGGARGMDSAALASWTMWKIRQRLLLEVPLF